MVRSYFKLAYRNLLRNKLSSVINIIGLSVAIGCCIIFFLMLYLEYTSDRFHENAENIFMVVYTLEGDQSAQRWGDSPFPLAPALETDFPQVKRAVRVADQVGKVRCNNKVFNESINFVDPDYLEMFTFPLKSGNKTALLENNALVLSEAIAEKYFSEESPIGKQVVITFNKNNHETFFVRGVAEKFPENASFGFDILVAYDKLQQIGKKDVNNWGKFVRATFIQVNNVNDIATISAQMSRYVKRHNVVRIDRPIASFSFEPLPTLSWESQEIERSISSGSTPQALIMLFIIGLALLVQACFNYVNIALASGNQRLKEIGIRKVVGSRRLQLVHQFLGENLLICCLALIGGLFLTEFVLLPGLMQITGNPEGMSLFDIFNNMHIWMFLILLLMLTGIGAGIYPALYISRMQPVSIMKGKHRIGGRKRFSGLLLTIQFGITFLVICLVVTFLQNNSYQRHRDWGYDQEHVINIRLEKGEQFKVLKNAVNQNPNVIQAAGTVHHIGRSQQQAVIEVEAKKHEVIRFDVGLNYLETMKIRLKEGRFFNPNLSTDYDASIIVNEQFVNKMGWQNAINQSACFGNKIYKVIGTVEDFHYNFFFEEIQPVVISLVPEETFKYLSARVHVGKGVQSKNNFRKTWRKLFPDDPYSAFFQDSVFENGFRNNIVITQIFTAISCITLVISCMGLFGLVTLMISGRTKDISIHKVLGASIIQISNLITKRYAILLTTAIIIAIPGGYLFLNVLLDGIYKYHIVLSAIPFILAATVVLFTAFLTIASQVYRAATRNPIDAIRYE